MKNVIDLNRTRIEPSLENYNLVVSEFLNSNKLVHVSIEEIIFDSEKCINNLDKFFDITTRIGNESFISTELGLEAIALCKELNINLSSKRNIFNKNQIVISNEEVNVGLIAMIAAAVIAIGLVLKKIWNLLTGNSSSNNSSSGGNVEEKKKAIDTTEKIIATYNTTTPAIKTKMTDVNQTMISYAKEIKSNNEITDNLLKFKTIFEYIDSDLRHPSLSGIANTLENFYDSLNGISKAIIFSELDDSFYGKIEEILSDSSEVVKYISPVIKNIDDSVDSIAAAYGKLNSSGGISKQMRLINVDIDKATELLSKDKINDDNEMNNISNLADKIKNVNISGLEVHGKELNSAVFFNLYGSEGVHKVTNLIYKYQEFLDKTVRQFPSQFDDRFKNINTDLTNIESNYKTLFENNTNEDVSNFKEKIDNYFFIVKEIITRLNTIVTSIARAAVLSETILDANNKIFIGMVMHKSVMIEAFTRLAKLILNNNKSSGADGASAMEFVKQLNSLVELMNSTNKKIKDVIGDVGDYKDLNDKDVFKKFIKNANVISGKNYTVSKESHHPKITYLPSTESISNSSDYHRDKKLYDLNHRKVNKMIMGIDQVALEQFIARNNLEREIEIETGSTLEHFNKEIVITNENFDIYTNKIDQLLLLDKRIRSSQGITKELGLEALSICEDLNINVNKLTTFPSKSGYTASLEIIGVGLFALAIAAIIAIGVVIKKIFNFLFGGSSSSGGGGGGGATPEQKIEVIGTSAEVDTQIFENKSNVEEQMVEVATAIKDVVHDSTVHEAAKSIEKDLSPLVKYLLMSPGFTNIFDFLDNISTTDIGYDPLVRVVEQINNLKSFEKEIILEKVSGESINNILGFVENIVDEMPNYMNALADASTFTDSLLDTIQSITNANLSGDEAIEKYHTEYPKSITKQNPPVDDPLGFANRATEHANNVLSNTDFDNAQLKISNLYAYKGGLTDSGVKYDEYVNVLSDTIEKMSKYKIAEKSEFSIKAITHQLEQLEKAITKLRNDDNNATLVEMVMVEIKHVKLICDIFKQYFIAYGKTIIVFESIAKSKLKIDLIVETYLKSATGQLKQLSKQLKHDLNGIDPKYTNNDNFKKKLQTLYDQIDDLIILSQGGDKLILDIIAKDSAYKDISGNGETFNSFLEKCVILFKTNTGKEVSTEEYNSVYYKTNLVKLYISNEMHQAGFMSVIIAGILIVVSILSAIIKKIFGLSKGGNAKSTSESISNNSDAMKKMINNSYTAYSPSNFDFNLSGLNLSTMTKPSKMTDDEYRAVTTLGSELKRYGDKGIFDFFEEITNKVGIDNKNMEKAEDIKNKINNISDIARSMISGEFSNVWRQSMYNKNSILADNVTKTMGNNVLDNVFTIASSAQLTEDKLKDAIYQLQDENDILVDDNRTITDIIKNVQSSLENNDNEEYTLPTFMTKAEKLLTEKTLFESMSTIYNSSGMLLLAMQSFLNKIEVKKEKLEKLNIDTNNVPAESIAEFKQLYQDYIKNVTSLQATSLQLSTLVKRIMTEYKKLFQTYFSLSSNILATVVVVIEDLTDCSVNTVVQRQNLRKTISYFLKTAKSNLESLDKGIDKKEDNKMLILVEEDIAIWKKLIKKYEQLEKDVLKISSK